MIGASSRHLWFWSRYILLPIKRVTYSMCEYQITVKQYINDNIMVFTQANLLDGNSRSPHFQSCQHVGSSPSLSPIYIGSLFSDSLVYIKCCFRKCPNTGTDSFVNPPSPYLLITPSRLNGILITNRIIWSHWRRWTRLSQLPRERVTISIHWWDRSWPRSMV